MGRPIYVCNNCGKTFRRFEVVTRRQDGWHEHPDSLVRHLLDTQECNSADSLRRAALRAEDAYDDPSGEILTDSHGHAMDSDYIMEFGYE